MEVMPGELDATSVEFSSGSTKKELKISDWIHEARCSHRDAIQNYIKRKNGGNKGSALIAMKRGKAEFDGNKEACQSLATMTLRHIIHFPERLVHKVHFKIKKRGKWLPCVSRCIFPSTIDSVCTRL